MAIRVLTQRDTIGKPVRQFCRKCDHATPTWIDSYSHSHCSRCNPPWNTDDPWDPYFAEWRDDEFGEDA